MRRWGKEARHPASGGVVPMQGDTGTGGLMGRMPREIGIVDDHEAVRDALLEMVQEAGYAAVAFSSATAALARIGEHRPALVLLDMMMPEVDGADFLARLARLRDARSVPVIVVSAIGHLLQGLRGPTSTR